MKKISFFILLVIIFFGLTAQNSAVQKVQSTQKSNKNNESITLKFLVSNKDQINNDLTNILSIDNVIAIPDGKGYEVTAFANQQQLQIFKTRNISYEIIPKSIPKALTMATTVAQMANWDRYPIYSVYEQMMANFASTYPALCTIDTILSLTPSGNYRILVAKISDNVHTAENEPQFLYTSSMHGDETTGYILMLRLINYLLSNYGVIPKVTNLVNNAEIWINPLANPEGTYYLSSPVGSTVSNSRRYNLANVDLNRNYPDPRAGQHPDGNAWQPETVAFMGFAEAHHFNMAANFHGGAEVVNYPWDTWTSSGNQNADRLWWERVCTAYVDSNRLVTPTYLSSVVADGVTEGGDWYVITGGRQDYMNYFKHCREVTIELDDTKTTQTQNLNLKWDQNYRSLLNYIQESLYGVRGIITDSCSGQPIRAKVWVNSYDQTNDSSQVYSALPVGNYHKYMIAGTYSIEFSAPGYIAKTINNVSLINGSETVLNVQLVPDVSQLVQFTGTQNDLCSATIQFTNTSSSSSSFLWDFGDGTTSALSNPSHTYTSNGDFTVKLKAYNCKGADSLIKTDYITIDLPLITSVSNGSICDTGQVSLSAGGTGIIKWYADSTSGSPLGTGSPWLTPSLQTTTTYYAGTESSTSASVLATIGSGTASSGSTESAISPFGTYYHDSRHQFLVLASELTAAGLSAGNLTSIAFNIASIGGQAMSGFNISIGATSASTLTTTYVTGLTPVYSSSSYIPAGTGWQTITFSTPFIWNGTSNIVVQVCYDNTSYTTSTTVYYSTTVATLHHYGYMDNGTGCSMTTPTYNGVSLYRANMRFGGTTITNCYSHREAVVAYVNSGSKNLQLTLLLEALYAGGGLMHEAKNEDQLPELGAGIADTISVEFHDTANYNHIIYTAGNIELSTSGIALINALPCSMNDSYYITLQHRNSIETVSAVPVSFAAPVISYDFTTAASQAYENNLKAVTGGFFVVYGGDATKDGIVDLSDMVAIDNASRIALPGYNPEDVNGDGIVDISDMVLIDNNSIFAVQKRTP